MNARLKRRLRMIENSPMRDSYALPMEAQRRVAHGLLQNISESTPGGIAREQFRITRHPVKAAFAAFPFVALAVLVIVAAVTRHHP